MSKMVRKHLSRKYVLQDEIYLDQIVESQEKCETISFVVYILVLLVFMVSVVRCHYGEIHPVQLARVRGTQLQPHCPSERKHSK